MTYIPFNKPFTCGNELNYIEEAIASHQLSGNGRFTKLCQAFMEERYGFGHCLLTHSCTAALEMSALLIDIQPGDEVVMPAFTFVSTANAFVLRGAKIVFADSLDTHPNVDPAAIEALITPKTKAIVVVHYAGAACEMDRIMALAEQHKLYVIEDAAQALNSYYKGRPLGSIGHFATFSFHETKNIMAGEGGMLVVNDPQFMDRSDIIWEKGTNRVAFFRGMIDQYGWVDVGSSFLPSEITAAFLYAQLERLDEIHHTRVALWRNYERLLEAQFELPQIPAEVAHNGHIFYLVLRDIHERTRMINFLREQGIQGVFHYQSLHKSPYFSSQYEGTELPNSDRFTDCLLRLPLFQSLTLTEQAYISEQLLQFERVSTL